MPTKSTSNPLDVYLSQIESAANFGAPFDPDRLRAQTEEAAENAKKAILLRGAELAYKLAETTGQRQQADAGATASITQYGDKAQAVAQQSAAAGQADLQAQANAGQNAATAQAPVPPPVPGAPPQAPPAPQAPPPAALPPQPAAPNALQAALADQQARQQTYSQRLSQIADRAATDRMSSAGMVTNSALNQTEVNKAASQHAISQVEAQLKAAQEEALLEAAKDAAGGGGGGGGGGGSDDLTAGQTKSLIEEAMGGTDWRQQIGTRGGSKTLKDFIFGAKGGSKGHLNPDLSNIDEVYGRQVKSIKANKKWSAKQKKDRLNRLKWARDKAYKTRTKSDTERRKLMMASMYNESF